ncbi:LytTR family transcriptional regulator [Kibdelosporangium aridum]|uniref:LytTR family transcriptional regulator n=1 Tax=Kibdelosporangium aridum TaxID=2030 RepID=A0A428YBB9_KIBAR|nr:LCP family protein [Kibdelosporangium aridum]RSM64956.1 LytTR family transcriptional regulator [Kibdelosporangium aridum]
MSVAVLSASGIVYAKFNDVNEGVVTTDVISPEVSKPGVKPLDGAVDILLVGMDSREDAYGNPLPKEVRDLLHAGVNYGERNTDTMILVHIPVDGRRAVAISFPRDTYAEIAGGFGKHKLNSAFVYKYNDVLRGEKSPTDKQAMEKAKQEGRKNLIATIEGLIGKAVTIDRYAEVNLGSFYEITKAIGGVDVCLNNPVDEWRSGARFPAGRQTIEGAAALSFVRQRYELPNGDLDRIVRQQVFIGALAHKVLSTGVLTDLTKLNNLIEAIKKSVVLSTGWDVTTFAQQMQGLSSGAIDFHTIPTLGGAKIGGADVIRIDPKQVNEFVTSLTRDERTAPPSPPSSEAKPPATPTTVPPKSDTKVTVDVRNASGEAGLAAAVQNILTGKGFLPGAVGDAVPQRTSTLFYRPGEQANAERVSGELGGQFKLTADASLKTGQVRAVLGDDFPTAMGRALAGQTGPAAQGSPTTPSRTSSSAPPAPSAPPINANGVTCVN